MKYTLVPAAVGGVAGTLRFNGTWANGEGEFGSANLQRIHAGGSVTNVVVQVVDFPWWLATHFKVEVCWRAVINLAHPPICCLISKPSSHAGLRGGEE